MSNLYLVQDEEDEVQVMLQQQLIKIDKAIEAINRLSRILSGEEECEAT